jgi:hypothetical protein
VAKGSRKPRVGAVCLRRGRCIANASSKRRSNAFARSAGPAQLVQASLGRCPTTFNSLYAWAAGDERG